MPGAAGPRASASDLRRGFDLEHWPAFGASFTQLEDLLTSLATGQLSADGAPPATVTIISGDVHHSYLTAIDLPRTATRTSSATRTSAVYQAVCSPFHQAMPPTMRGAQWLASTRASGLIGTAVAKLAGARVPSIKWRITAGPWFENMIAILEFDGRAARLRFDRATTDKSGTPHLTATCEASLSTKVK